MSSAALRDLQNLHELRERLNREFPDAIPVPRRIGETVATGIAALDAILPSGGFPRGRLSVWAPNLRGGGATAVLRAACLATVMGGERAVWIDGAGVVAGAFWTTGPILVRPQSRVHALRAAESLVRSGGFALVVLAGAEPEGTENVRLSRAAHEGGGAIVALTNSATTAGLKIVSQLEPQSYVWRRDPFGDPAAIDSVMLQVRVSSLGWNRRARIAIPVSRHEWAAALPPMLPDRRGVMTNPRIRL